MKNLLLIPAHKLITFGCLIPSFIYILLYELVFTTIPSPSETIYKLGIIISKVAYSIMASSIFYYISQYIPLHLPKQKRKIKILLNVYHRTYLIDNIIKELQEELKISSEDFKSHGFRTLLANINTQNSVGSFENWYSYLLYIKTQLLEIIQSIIIHQEYLSIEFTQELIIIEKQLLEPNVFSGQNILSAFKGLEYAEIQIQEIYLHNQILQKLNINEFKKYEMELWKVGKEYRRINFGKKDSH